MRARWQPWSILTAASVALVLAGAVALVVAARDQGPWEEAGKAADRTGQMGDKVREIAE